MFFDIMKSTGLSLLILTLFVYNGVHAQTLVGHWTFEKGVETKDLTGNFGDIILQRGAVIQDGVLDVGPGNYAVAGSYTGPTISTKTLVSWVSIDSFNTQKGSVLTIDKLSTDEFDAIVFGEFQNKRWAAGSSGGKRSNFAPTPGFEERELDIPIQIAITYENGNGGTHVILYRNGDKIGDYTKGPLASWPAGDAEIFWGLRHGDANSGGPGSLDVKIEESRIYDSVLTAEQLKGLKIKEEHFELVGQFTFENGEETIDITGNFGDIVLQGATIENGLLEVGTGRGAMTGAYKGPEIHEKTLVSWVSIESLPIQKSSVPSILVDNTDAVVPGSVFEKVKLNVMVQLAISYQSTSGNAHIKLYENGEKFRDYIKGSFVDVQSGNSAIFWGDRKTDSEDCGLGMCHTADAHIEESRIYSGVLTEDDLKSLVPKKDSVAIVANTAAASESFEGAAMAMATGLKYQEIEELAEGEEHQQPKNEDKWEEEQEEEKAEIEEDYVAKPASSVDINKMRQHLFRHRAETEY